MTRACLLLAVMPLRVSIVVPMYNTEQYLASTVESVLGQTFEDWELVLFDDGSQDRTLEIARDFERRDRRIRVVEGVNGGTAAARNRGFAATSTVSEFVIFLDNDDTWEPDALRLLIEALEAHPEYPAVLADRCSSYRAGGYYRVRSSRRAPTTCQMRPSPRLRKWSC